MQEVFYKFYILKGPVCCIAWNALLALHTFRQTPEPSKAETYARAMLLMQDAGCNPMAESSFILFCCYLAYSFAEQGKIPKVQHGDAKWYPIERPAWILSTTPFKVPAAIEKVRHDVLNGFGTEIPDIESLGDNFHEILFGKDGEK